jgi:Tol biopolymer transport system component
MNIFRGLFFCVFISFSLHLSAQTVLNQVEYGKNRIQYKKFDWYVLTSQNFELYFYAGGEPIAKMAAGYGEADFTRMTDLVGYSPYSKVKIFIYNSVADLQQSNVGIDAQGYSVGGQTKFFSPQIELAFTGDKASFQKELNRSIASALVFEMMYGGNLKETLKSAYLLTLPDWYIAGVTQYLAEGWTVELDNYMRDMLKYRKLKNIDSYQGLDAQFIGHSMWNYIAEEYGKQSIANILNLTRIVRNAESGVQNTIGVSYNRFTTDWKKFYIDQTNSISNEHTAVPTAQMLRQNKRDLELNHLQINTAQNLLAFSENNKGAYKIKIRNLQNGKETTVFKGGYRTTQQAIDANIPLLTWRNETELAIIGYQKGILKLWFYDTKTQKLSAKELPFAHIQSFASSDDGKNLVFSAEKEGQNDIYTYSIENQTVKQLTNDIFDDISPTFLKKSNEIVFASNRTNDTIAIAKKGTLSDISDKFSIFIYKPSNKDILQRLTNTLSKDTNPLAANEHLILFLSNQRGIVHLFGYDLTTGVSKQITGFEHSIDRYDFNNNRFVFSMLHKGKEELFLMNNFDVTSLSVFTSKTIRQQKIDLKQLALLRQKRQENDKNTPQTTQNTKKDSIEGVNPYNIDTDNYVFDLKSPEKTKKKKLLEGYKPTEVEGFKRKPESVELSKPEKYTNRFSAENITSTMIIDPRYALVPDKVGFLRGATLQLQTGIVELFENHRFNLGVGVLVNLSTPNTNYFLDYQYLRKRLDYRFRFDRQTYSISGVQQSFLQRYALNKAQASVSYAIDTRQRVTGTVFAANTTFATTSSLVSSTFLKVAQEEVYYGGFGISYTFDNVIIPAPNVADGLKAKISYENYTGLNKENKSFGNIYAEAKYYRQLGKKLLFAGRIMYGQFLGTARKSYRVGGVENWIFNKSDAFSSTSPLYYDESPTVEAATRNYSDMLFTPYLMPLRGFNYNRLSGDGAFLMNLELRIPVLNYLSRGNITSNFIKNLQFVGFYDIGTAWNGYNPFSRDNALNFTEFSVVGNPFYAKVYNFKNPFLMGYGAGLRTMLLGFHLRGDFAWGVEDNISATKPIFYLSFGHDF